MLSFLYSSLLVPLLRLFFLILSPLHPKARRRRQGVKATLRWLRASPPSSQSPSPLWFHVASAGEALQLRPLLERIAGTPHHLPLLVSHFSPSAEPGLAKLPYVAKAFYLSWDSRRATRLTLEALKPALLAFVASDVWPNLVREATHRRVPLAWLAASLPPDSRRQWPFLRPFFRSLYGAFDFIGAASEEDARALEELGVPPARLNVTGDPRYDLTLERLSRVALDDPDLTPLDRATPWLIAGSTWEEDEALLLAACRALWAEGQAFQLCLVPHEPTPRHLFRLKKQLEALRLTYQVWSTLVGRDRDRVDETTRVVIVDRVGLLYKLYRRGAVAYVGGGFGPGVHNVMEPAACGLPVLFGSRYKNSETARRLVAAGGGHVVRTPGELAATLTAWWADPRLREAVGAQAREVVEQGAGATRRTLTALRSRFPHLFPPLGPLQSP